MNTIPRELERREALTAATPPEAYASPLRRGGVVGAAASFYRFTSWPTKVSGFRHILLTILGYAVALPENLPLLCVNGLAVAGLLFFYGAYGNYWDWRLLGEDNGTRAVSERYGLSHRTAWMLSLAPWVGIVPCLLWGRILGLSGIAEALFWVAALLGVVYITPGIRLKCRRGGFMTPPVAWWCLYLQAYLVEGPAVVSSQALAFAGLLFLYLCQAELLHLLVDDLHNPTEPRHLRRHVLLRWLRAFPWLTGVASLGAALVHPMFLNTTVWSAVRWRALKRLDLGQVAEQRRQFWRAVLSLYEFGIYAVLGILGMFT